MEIDCPECGEIYRTTAAIKKHYDSIHNNKEICPWKSASGGDKVNVPINIADIQIPKKISIEYIFIIQRATPPV